MRWRSVVVTLLIAELLAGCGGDAEPTPADAGGTRSAPGSGGDPACSDTGLYCSKVADGTYFEVSASVSDGVLEVELTNESVWGATYAGWENGAPAVVVDDTLGKVLDVWGRTSSVSIRIALSPGATEGRMTLDGTVVSTKNASCGGDTRCAVHGEWVIAVQDGGVGTEGITISITPTSGVGPLYDDPSGLPDVNLGATSPWGAAHFANVAPGEVDVKTDPACTPNFGGWRSTKIDSVRVPIVAGFETHVGFYCAP